MRRQAFFFVPLLCARTSSGALSAAVVAASTGSHPQGDDVIRMLPKAERRVSAHVAKPREKLQQRVLLAQAPAQNHSGLPVEHAGGAGVDALQKLRSFHLPSLWSLAATPKVKESRKDGHESGKPLGHGSDGHAERLAAAHRPVHVEPLLGKAGQEPSKASPAHHALAAPAVKKEGEGREEMRGITMRSHAKQYRNFEEAGILREAQPSHVHLLYGPAVCFIIYLLWHHNRRLALERHGAKRSLWAEFGEGVYVPGFGEGEKLLGSLFGSRRRESNAAVWLRGDDHL